MRTHSFSIILLAVAISIPSTLIVSRLVDPPLEVVTFDLKGTVRAYSQELSTQNLTDAAITQKTQQFEFLLQENLNRYSQENHATILVAPAVVKGAYDITKTIQQEIRLQLTRMRDM
ncbi:type-F conjugative transfer system protein TrbI [Photobacterium damselae]|uniref:type-F conjugative transfer system protein TrbI n=1 Tax=Photobacterium damselae TaxID=38293 RepID=UPI004068C663